jgi:PPOX class probable F420-dependent enzyme
MFAWFGPLAVADSGAFVHILTRRRALHPLALTIAQQSEINVKLSDDLLALLRKPCLCFLATTMADGSPQVTEVWGDTDGQRVIINSVQSHLKVKNMARDPRVAIAIADPDEPSRYAQVRGRVVDVTTEGAADHIEQLAQKYLGGPYPWYGGRDQVRVIITIEPERVTDPR